MGGLGGKDVGTGAVTGVDEVLVYELLEVLLVDVASLALVCGCVVPL